MNIFCTGISGSGRKELIADFEARCVQRELNIDFFNLFDVVSQQYVCQSVQARRVPIL